MTKPYPKPTSHLNWQGVGEGGGDNKNTTRGPPSPLLSLLPGGASGCCPAPLSGFRGVLGLSLLPPNPRLPPQAVGRRQEDQASHPKQTRHWCLPRGVSTRPLLTTQGQRVWEQLTLPSRTALLTGCGEAWMPGLIAPWAWEAPVLKPLA